MCYLHYIQVSCMEPTSEVGQWRWPKQPDVNWYSGKARAIEAPQPKIMGSRTGEVFVFVE